MDVRYYKKYHHLEQNHWWFRARMNILKSIISSHLSSKNTNTLKVLNAGVATGATTIMLQDFGDVTSIEYNKECCDFLKEYVGIDALNQSLTDLKLPDNSFDMVCAFDVIEHIEDDQKSMDELFRVLKPGGKFFVTVPAFQALWGNHDVVNHHMKRYKKKGFNKLALESGFKIEYSSYFNFWLFVPIAFARLAMNLIPRKHTATDIGTDNEILKDAHLFNKICYSIFNSEGGILNKKIKLPFGVSIMTWGTKN